MFKSCGRRLTDLIAYHLIEHSLARKHSIMKHNAIIILVPSTDFGGEAGWVIKKPLLELYNPSIPSFQEHYERCFGDHIAVLLALIIQLSCSYGGRETQQYGYIVQIFLLVASGHDCQDEQQAAARSNKDLILVALEREKSYLSNASRFLVLVKLWFGISRGEGELVSDIENKGKQKVSTNGGRETQQYGYIVQIFLLVASGHDCQDEQQAAARSNKDLILVALEREKSYLSNASRFLVLVKLWFGISRGEGELVSDIENKGKQKVSTSGSYTHNDVILSPEENCSFEPARYH
eukprot:sb/3467558/